MIIIRVSRTLISFMSPLLGLSKTLEVDGRGFVPRKVYGWLIYVPMYLGLNFRCLEYNLRCQDPSCPSWLSYWGFQEHWMFLVEILLLISTWMFQKYPK